MVHYPKHCGNSPKISFAMDIEAWMVEKKLAELMEVFDAKCMYEVIGQTSVEGKDSLLEHLTKAAPPDEMWIEGALAHGRHASVFGHLRRGDRVFQFHDLLEFSTLKADKIKLMKCFVIEQKRA